MPRRAPREVVEEPTTEVSTVPTKPDCDTCKNTGAIPHTISAGIVTQWMDCTDCVKCPKCVNGKLKDAQPCPDCVNGRVSKVSLG